MTTFLNSALVKGLVKVFVAAILGAFILGGKDVFSTSLSDWKLYAGAGVTALVVSILTYIDPSDPRFGLGA